MDNPKDAIGEEFDSINDVPESVIEHSELATVKKYNGNWKVITEEHWEENES